MKIGVRVLVILLTLCQLLCLFSGCKKKEEDSGEDAPFSLQKDQLASYTIVYARSGGADMRETAIKLQGMLEKVAGTKLEVKEDYLVEGSDVHREREYEILVGYTDRSVTREFYPQVRADDYGYALVGKKLLIVGHTAERAAKSVNAFQLNVLKKIDSTGLILSADTREVTQGSYRYDLLRLNGEEISRYQIVYPEFNRQGEPEIAAGLRDWITQQTGYVIPCVADLAAPSAYEIQVGDTNRITDTMSGVRTSAGFGDGKYYIGQGENTVWLSGKDRTGVYLAFTKFLSMAVTEEKSLTLDVNASACYEINSFELSAMSYNVYYDLSERLRNPDDVVASIQQKAADVFGLNEAGLDWIEKVDLAVNATYACVKGKALENGENASYNPIFYKKDRFELVESGTKWLSDTPDRMSKYSDAKHYKGFTYAILKDRTTGAQFMYLNTHLDGSNDADVHSAMKECHSSFIILFIGCTSC